MAGSRRLIRCLTVLVDMDGVMCDFEKHMLLEFRKRYPREPFVLPDDRRTFYMAEQYDELKPGLALKINQIMNEKGFFLTMPPIAGAVDAVKEMSEMDGVQVFICTSPVDDSLFCVSEKFAWVKEHLGSEWIKQTILTSDKTLIHGDILIDDRNHVTGLVSPPSWDHIIFTQAHNRHLTASEGQRQFGFVGRLENWTDGSWHSLIETYRQRLCSMSST